MNGELAKSHRIATEADIEKLCQLLQDSPQNVIVQDLNGGPSEVVTKFVQGPFSLKEESGRFYIVGTYKKSGQEMHLRIKDSEGLHSVFFRDPGGDWQAQGDESFRIYIPK